MYIEIIVLFQELIFKMKIHELYLSKKIYLNVCILFQIIHETIIDTSLVFPHKMGPPYKRALRTLASEYLKKIIQNDG